jgi:hypothetical protein
MSLDIRQFVTNKKTGKPLRGKFEAGLRMPLVFRASRSEKELQMIDAMKRDTGAAEDVHQSDRDDSALPQTARFVPFVKPTPRERRRAEEVVVDDDVDDHDDDDNDDDNDDDDDDDDDDREVHEDDDPPRPKRSSAVVVKRRRVSKQVGPDAVLVPSSPTTSQVVPMTQSRLSLPSQARPLSSAILVPSTPDEVAFDDTVDGDGIDADADAASESSSSVFYPTTSQLTPRTQTQSQGQSSSQQTQANPIPSSDSSASIAVQLE